jgi:hypothetical protein
MCRPSFSGMKNIIAFSAFALATTPVFADITVRFQESAPKDRFVISSSCAISDMAMSIDLTGSAGSLIFDVTAEGAGVEVFQPVEVQAGQASVPAVRDGDQVLAFNVSALPATADVIISADLDDVLPQSSLGQIRVSGSELDGARIAIEFEGQRQEASFENGTNQVIFAHGCIS